MPVNAPATEIAAEHTDAEELAGQVRALCNQIALVRKRGIALPLMLVSYLQAAKGEGAWFSWETGQPHPFVREAGACVSLTGSDRLPTTLPAPPTCAVAYRSVARRLG